MTATLRPLLERDDLQLTLLEGDPDTAYGSVAVAGRDADRPWLRAGDLRLHEGRFALPRPPTDPVLDPPPAAVVHALSPRQRAVPVALVERCRAAGVALLSSPPTVSPEAVEEAALQALVDSAGGALAGLATLQRQLLATLEGPKPERDVLERVSRLSGMGMALLSPWGEVVARAGDTTGRLGGTDPTTLAEGRMRLGGRDALVARVAVRGRLRSALIALKAGPAPAARLRGGGRGALGWRAPVRSRVRSALSAFEAGPGSATWLEGARTLLDAAALQRSAEAQQGRSRMGALLAEWLAGPQAAPM